MVHSNKTKVTILGKAGGGEGVTGMGKEEGEKREGETAITMRCAHLWNCQSGVCLSPSEGIYL